MEVWAFHSHHVCYASILQSMANDGGKIKTFKVKSLINKNNIYYKIIYKIIKNETISQNLVLLCLEHIYLLFTVKNENRKKYFLSHFGHYLISACCDI